MNLSEHDEKISTIWANVESVFIKNQLNNQKTNFYQIF